LTPVRKERSEVGVGRYDDAAFALGALEDRFVACTLQAIVTNVNGIMTGGAQLLGNDRRKGVIDEEPHPAATSGSSRSRTASAA
jgi:hypothetical protein